jgi:hypothetical protein
MLVTFSCEVYADIIYFGDVAQSLLKMMGRSGSVPGALLAEDVPKALERLQSAVAELKGAATQDSASVAEGQDDWKEKPVSLVQRALPLLELLGAAAKANCNVMWDRR